MEGQNERAVALWKEADASEMRLRDHVFGGGGRREHGEKRRKDGREGGGQLDRLSGEVKRLRREVAELRSMLEKALRRRER